MKVTCHGCDCELDDEDVRGETLHGWPLCMDCHYQSHASDGCWDDEAEPELDRADQLDRVEMELLDMHDGDGAI